MLDSIGNRLVAALPDDPEEAILNRIRNGARPSSDESAPQTQAAPAEEQGYSDTERRGLEQLTTSGSSTN